MTNAPWDKCPASMGVVACVISPLLVWRIVYEFIRLDVDHAFLMVGWTSALAWMLAASTMLLRSRMQTTGWDRDRFLRGIGIPSDVASLARECAIAVPLLVLVVVLILAATWIADRLDVRMSSTANAQVVWRSGEPYSAATWLGVVALVIVGPWAEEVFYRGFLYSSLRRRLGSPAALIGQGGAFALMHDIDPRRTPSLFVLGIALVGVYRWRGLLLSSIAVHALLNVVVLIMSMCTAPSSEPWIGVEGRGAEDRCCISGVVRDSPAATSGLEVGDLVISVNGEPIGSFSALQRVIRACQPGDRVRIEVDREGAILILHVVVAGRPRGGRK